MTLRHSFPDIRPATGTSFDRLLAQLATPPTRRTARLLRAGTARKARKLVEEAPELALDATSGNRRGTIEESVDLLHLLAVLWHDQGIAPREVWAEMDRRAAVLGIAGKLPRKGPTKKALKAGRLYRDGDRIGPVPLSAARPD